MCEYLSELIRELLGKVMLIAVTSFEYCDFSRSTSKTSLMNPATAKLVPASQLQQYSVNSSKPTLVLVIQIWVLRFQ